MDVRLEFPFCRFGSLWCRKFLLNQNSVYMPSLIRYFSKLNWDNYKNDKTRFTNGSTRGLKNVSKGTIYVD